MALKNIALTALIALSFAAFGAENTENENKVKLKDIDSEITNARMRADSGSKSKYSGSMSFSYNGGSINDPASSLRPSLQITDTDRIQANLTGSVSARYRINPKLSATLGLGLRMFQPLHSSLESSRQAEENFDILNPSLGLSAAGKIGVLQTRYGLGFTYGTSEGWENAGIDYNAGAFFTGLTTLDAKKKLTFGVSLGYDNYFLKAVDLGNGTSGVRNPFAATIGVYPFAEYALSDTYQLRTVFGYFNFYNPTGRDANVWHRDQMYQSVGLTIVTSRDSYFYPNVQFLPERLATDKTNVGISATINAF